MRHFLQPKGALPAPLQATFRTWKDSPHSDRTFVRLCVCAAKSLHPILRCPAGTLAPLLHALQFMGDLGAHEVVDGDLIHIFWQARPAREACAQPRQWCGRVH